ncbi:acyltransferase family protein [Novosphingobium sp. KACC 22771]|uniref:acyltransferase family protein n=1 Tax=Novosphingobium sp. KACC 22771 TaxID=3025670 RepID=UPI002365A1E8|nr:acyltransferase [Novosphingobium sp. KACC 22771]WDF72965.1 acyltransferase [Novosphingobium sp. KACC 22771]
MIMATGLPDMRSILRRLSGLPERFERVVRGQNYIPQLDGLRFFAIIPVLLWHASIRGYRSFAQMSGRPSSGEPHWLPHGEIGVDLFFVISGFVIARPFLAKLERCRSLDIGHFYLRRLLRLQPPYLLVLLCCAIVASLGIAQEGRNLTRSMSSLEQTWISFWASAFYVHVLVFGQPSALNPPIWSLETEVQFYLVSPLLIWLYMGLSPKTSRLIVGIWAMALVTAAGAALRSSTGIYAPWSFTLATHLAPFMLGCLLADVRPLRHHPRKPAKLMGDDGFLLGLSLLVASGYWEMADKFLPILLRDTVRLAACALIVEGALNGTWVAQMAGSRWIALIGSACYSIYLVHVPLMVTVWLVIGNVLHPPAYLIMPLAMTLLPFLGIAGGLVFFAAVERPFMDSHWPSRLIGAFTAPFQRSENSR